MQIEHYKNYNEAIQAALDWLRERNVDLDEAFETKFGNFGMRSRDRSGGYRLEFDTSTQAHINVWCHAEKGPHYLFPGNRATVRSLWRQLYQWDPRLMLRSEEDSTI